MSVTVTTEVDVEVELDDVLEDTTTEDLVEAIQDRLEVEGGKRDVFDVLFGDLWQSPDDARVFIKRLCAIRSGLYIDKATAKRIICELIDDVFFEV